ncbi:glycoside hydrolase family 5 protein [Peniophora sp. CONT]|nr:glycoside hydrolase family 5 protein [Peniophora sp. CONT]
MLKLRASVIVAALMLPSALAQAAVWGQCGGTNWVGPTTCAFGSACVYNNAWFSQCLPVATTATSAAATTTAKATTVPATSSVAHSTTSATAPASTGFVKANGQKFELDGKEYILVGENTYWVGLMGYNTTLMDQGFKDIAATGATTARTMGFNEVTSDPGIYVPYYQIWNGSIPTVNTGSNGLQNFDNVVASAKKNGLRLIVALTNNWSDFGGSDVYVTQLLGPNLPHDYFYTNATVIAAYKNYVKTFVTRYLNEPTILAWELMNEPRCSGSTSVASSSCTPATITNWATEMSAFIKSIDSNHMVSVGDEGFFNEPDNANWLYQGTLGVDTVALTNISTIDFGTFHMYPLGYGQTADPIGFGSQYIADHAAVQKELNKPMILEEFGVTQPDVDQVTAYTQWYKDLIADGLTGDLIWQAGSSFTTNLDDGYEVYPGTAVYDVVTEYAAALKARE